MKLSCRRGIILISALIMILTVSCGIPTIANFDPGITYSSSSKTYTFNSEAASNSVPYGLEHLKSETLTSTSSPSILFMYNISESGTNYSSTFVSRFNTLYRKSSSSYFGVPVTFTTSDDRVCDYTTTYSTTGNSFSMGLYPFTIPVGSDTVTYPSAPDYTEVLKDALINGTTSIRIAVPSSMTRNNALTLQIYDNTSGEVISELELYRKNGDVFYSFDDLMNLDNATYLKNFPEYNDWSSRYDSRSDVTTTTYLNIYAAINVTKGTNADFSNMYWTALVRLDSIPIN